ncbi:MAG: hypothetical protein ABIR30_12235 [Chitinophagaceae bacterium]
MLRYPVICLLFLLSFKSFGNNSIPPELPKKIITITINPNGIIYMGPDTIGTNLLAEKLQERLWRSYLGNDKMYDEIKIVLAGEVLMGVRGTALDAIKRAQQETIKDICLQKFKRLYENLDTRQQSKLMKQFPVLFQELHW